MPAHKIYLASSWRNPAQPATVLWLRSLGHTVYDFRNTPEQSGFGWEETQAEEEEPGSTDAFLRALLHPVAKAGYIDDYEAMKWADRFILLMPCGKSAHLEAGWAIGQGVPTAILLPVTGIDEWELMYKLADVVTDDLDVIKRWLGYVSPKELVSPEEFASDPETSSLRVHMIKQGDDLRPIEPRLIVTRFMAPDDIRNDVPLHHL